MIMKMTQEILEFISKYADFYLAEAEKETNSFKVREKYAKYDGMRELINVVIDEMNNK